MDFKASHHISKLFAVERIMSGCICTVKVESGPTQPKGSDVGVML